MSNFSMDEVIGQIQKDHENMKLLHYDKNIPVGISVFVGFYSEAKDLKEDWSQLVSSIATMYQSKLSDDFSKWNTYLIFVCNESISKSLHYEIENDKFASRKLVLHSYQKNSTVDGISSFIEDKVLHKISLVKPDVTLQTHYSSNSSIWEIISSSDFDKDDPDDKVEKILARIDKKLKDENK